MSEQQFQAEVMSELQILEIEKDIYVGCAYCGKPKVDRIECCGENHFMEMQDE